ncbi:DUF6082 family protein [Streptomyces sp. NPDC059070]|uniref:DUF6082 family protein n=1 Tax=Streptomyces sp. NPDC059070 TaxID=3346713 RepID=UPI0036AC5A1F
MKPAHAVLALAASQVVGIALTERHRRRKLTVAMESMHQDSIARLMEQPLQLADQKPTGMTAEEFQTAIQANLALSLLHVKFRVGLLDLVSLRTQAEVAMRRRGVRLYWQHFAKLREQEASDRLDDKFNEVFRCEFDFCQDVEAARSDTAA